jgi:hypothetical protein
VIWTTVVCPKCGHEVAVGVMSLCATCTCDAFYADVEGCRGWYASREAYQNGDERIDDKRGLS